MTVNFEAYFAPSLKRLEENLRKSSEPILRGEHYQDDDENIITRGKKITENSRLEERGVFWNGRLIIPSSMIPNGRNVRLDAVRCFTDQKGIRREGEVYEGRLLCGTLIHPTGQTLSGVFNENERLIEGEIVQNQLFVRYTLKGLFFHKIINNELITRCQGTKTYSVSKYEENGLFENGVNIDPEPPEESRTDEFGVIRKGAFKDDKLVKGRISYPDYRLDGVFSYDSDHTICEGVKTGPKGSYKATGVFCNGVQKTGIIQFKDGREEIIDEQSTEEDLDYLQPEVPFRLFLDE